ncbi:MAG: hypothetical protein ACM3S1_03510 [Hyphomicrobiales bacterium]
MAVPEFIRKPLKGMGTGLGRFVLKIVRLGLIGAAVTAVLIVLDSLLLPDADRDAVDRQAAPE